MRYYEKFYILLNKLDLQLALSLSAYLPTAALVYAFRACLLVADDDQREHNAVTNCSFSVICIGDFVSVVE